MGGREGLTVAGAGIPELQKFAAAIKRYPAEAEKALELALNAGAELALKLGADQIFRELNLEREQITKALSISKKASSGNLSARISAKPRPVLLTRFGGDKVATKAATSPGRKLRGDPSRGIARGQKAAGIKAFSTQRGKAGKAWAGGFLIRLKGGNGWGLATRTGRGPKAYRIRYGPSVSSAWKSVRGDVSREAFAEVESVFIREFKGKL